jgi:hypothetical protein
MSVHEQEVKVTGTRRAGKKFPDLHPSVPFVDVTSKDDDSGPPKVSLKVRIDPASGDECSNLTKIKMEMLESLHGQSARYVHTRYLLDKLVFPKQGITVQRIASSGFISLRACWAQRRSLLSPACSVELLKKSLR